MPDLLWDFIEFDLDMFIIRIFLTTRSVVVPGGPTWRNKCRTQVQNIAATVCFNLASFRSKMSLEFGFFNQRFIKFQANAVERTSRANRSDAQ